MDDNGYIARLIAFSKRLNPDQNMQIRAEAIHRLAEQAESIASLQERNAKLEAALKEITETNCFRRSNDLGECAKAIAREALASERSCR